jgi:hypothetical protein
MRIQIEYSEDGEIKSVAGAEPSTQTGRIARANHKIAVIDTEEVRHKRDFAGLRRVVENYRVIGHPHRPSLTRKTTTCP